MHEFELIKKCFADWGIDHPNVIKGIGDDCLVWLDPEPLVISTDTAVIHRHFPEHATAAQVAARAFLPAISDLAAMAATPAFFTLALTLPKTLNNDWLIEFAQELRCLAGQYACMLAGGDTTSGDQLTVTLSVHGTCAHPVMRSGAKPGDDIWVTGSLGQAAAALPYILIGDESEAPEAWLQAYWQPEPQIKLAQALLGCIHSAIDISDGLVGDAAHIAHQSEVDLHIELTDIPIDDEVKALGTQGLKYALAGGDDYQLCFTAAAMARLEISEIAKQQATQVTRIGTVSEREVKEGISRVHWYDNGELTELSWQSFEHF